MEMEKIDINTSAATQACACAAESRPRPALQSRHSRRRPHPESGTIGNDLFYIHFDQPETCRDFMDDYNGNGKIGHICCNGKGCHLLDITSWKEIHALRNKFLASKSK
jgi:hypothetical protein